MLADRHTLRSEGPVREAMRGLRQHRERGDTDDRDRRLLWRARLQEFVASAPELREERERAEREAG